MYQKSSPLRRSIGARLLAYIVGDGGPKGRILASPKWRTAQDPAQGRIPDNRPPVGGNVFRFVSYGRTPMQKRAKGVVTGEKLRLRKL